MPLTNQCTAYLARIHQVRCIHDRDPALTDKTRNLLDGNTRGFRQLLYIGTLLLPQIIHANLVFAFDLLDAVRANVSEIGSKQSAAARAIRKFHNNSPLIEYQIKP